MRSKYSFNEAADLYDEVRPSYPEELIDTIVQKTELTLQSKLLEIAPGTGQATKKFGERGYKIHAVELGDKLAELLRVNCKDMNLTVDVAPFEEWKTEDTYNMIYCATAFHWLDKEVKYEKCASLLEDDGYLVLLWNNAIGTTNPIINEAYNLLFAYYPERPHSTKSRSVEAVSNQKLHGKEEIEESGYFILENYIEKKWTLTQPKERMIKGFYTQSSYLSLGETDKKELTEKLEILFENLEEIVEADFITTVYVCKKK